MKRIGAIGTIALVGILASVALARAHAGTSALAHARAGSVRQASRSAGATPRAFLSGLACHAAAVQPDRSVSVRASMRPVTGTEKLQIRFELLMRTGAGAPFVEVPGTGLGTWISPPNPTLGQRAGDVWIVSHSVSNLPAPATYRYRVSFRWLGSSGHTLDVLTRASADCHEPLFHADLRVSSISIQPIAGKPRKDYYVATIANDGLAPTPGSFAVSFTATTPSGAAVQNMTVPGLAAGASTAVTFVGPACTADTAPTVVADPGHKAGESDYANNSLTVEATCPPVTSGP